MEINPDVKQKIQIALALAIAIAGIRTAYVLYERRAAAKNETQAQAAPPLNPDYYVTPKKLYPYDLKSARQLTRQPVWVKEGYRYIYYPYNRATRRTDFDHDAGMLLPIQRLEIKDVVTDVAPNSGGQKQVMALFEQDGKTYAFQIGLIKDGENKIYSDEMLYVQDPRELYKHWSPDVWASVEKHEVKHGMNELQADFAIGMGRPDRQDDPSWKTVHYPNGKNPVTITYHDGKAVEIKPDKTG
ncbi:MAG: hypothetical protein WA628_22325 [Terriglobales bacterium]